MSTLADLLAGFMTWQTPLSFLAGVGAHHLYVKFWRDRPTQGEGDGVPST